MMEDKKDSKIKVVAFDVDGVLTDGIYQVSDKGRVIKSFYTRDFHGLEQLHRNKIPIIIITGSDGKCIKRKIKSLDFPVKLIANAVTKQYEINAIIGDLSQTEKLFNSLYALRLSWDNIAYMGDSENDLKCMKLAGFSGCPEDAIQEVREVADFISLHNGGHGAVWEFSEYILKYMNK